MKQWAASGLAQRGILAVAILLLSSAVAHGATYYVRTDGNNGNDGLTNIPAGAWRTIDWAAARVSAGDVVRVQTGTYAERVTAQISGAAGNPITFVADGAVTFCGMDISSSNYLRVIGFTIDTDAGGCTKSRRAVAVSGTNTGLEFWHNTFRDANGAGIGHGAYADRHHNFIVIGNTFRAIGPGGSAISLRGNNNLFAYNEIDGVDLDAFQVDGTYGRWLNNYIHNVLDTLDGHSDVFQGASSSLGTSYNLFEGNFAIGAGNLPNEHGGFHTNRTRESCSTGTCGDITENLFRRNVWHNTSGGVIGMEGGTEGPITNVRQVHDTVVEAARTAGSQTYAISFSGTGTTAYLFNNIAYKAWGPDAASNIRVFTTDGSARIIGADYNLSYTPAGTPTHTTPWTSQANELTNVNPSLTAVASDDFTIGSGSGARNAGGPLTRTSGSGTGTTFNVVTGGGGFFRGPNSSVSQYGGNLTAGDVITVGTTTLTVSRVSGDAITVTRSFTWAAGDPVFLGATTTPDVGAYPYNTGGYNLTATYSLSAGTVSVTVSDPRLVRLVVCYGDGIPTTVDNSSPYTCSVGSGSLDVRVYPLFASKTRFVRATAGVDAPSAPSAPTNLRIVPSEMARAFEQPNPGSLAFGPRN